MGFEELQPLSAGMADEGAGAGVGGDGGEEGGGDYGVGVGG